MDGIVMVSTFVAINRLSGTVVTFDPKVNVNSSAPPVNGLRYPPVLQFIALYVTLDSLLQHSNADAPIETKFSGSVTEVMFVP